MQPEEKCNCLAWNKEKDTCLACNTGGKDKDKYKCTFKGEVCKLSAVLSVTKRMSLDGKKAEIKEMSGKVVESVGFQLRVENVQYDKLMKSPDTLDEFKITTKVAISISAGKDILPEHVKLKLSAGSVIVEATITPPARVSADMLSANLNKDQAKMTNLVTKQIQQVSGIADVSTGTIGVSLAKTPAVQSVPLVVKAENSMVADEDGGDGGLIAGAVVGASAIVVLMCISTYLYTKLRRVEKTVTEGSQPNPAAMGNPSFNPVGSNQEYTPPDIGMEVASGGGMTVVGIPVISSMPDPGKVQL